MAVHLLRSKSGQGWDEITCTPIIDDDVFEDLLKVHPNIKNLNKVPFPFYNDHLEIFGKGGTAAGRVTCGICDGPPSPKNLLHMEGFDTPIDLDDQRCTEILYDIINEGIDMQHPTAVEAETQATPTTQKLPSNPKSGAGSIQTTKKRAKKSEMTTDSAIANVSSQLGELKPILFKVVEALGSITSERSERDGDNSKQAALIKEIGKIDGLTRGQVIDAAMALVDNDPKTRLFYALESDEDRCHFIKNLLR
ncbi:unnamed protein product [Linum trigynum]|uniref:Uncharacterized protein n=1 Tax=Linum trigynum TaxID=586398 RepID=A0AAV2GM22_9ROSI